jgi:hypothetical protein
VTATNLSTGRTIDVNISGPYQLSFSGNTVVSTGPSIQPLPANLLTAAGLPPVPLIHGQIVFTVDDQGNVTSIQRVTGTVKDVCQLLQ